MKKTKSNKKKVKNFGTFSPIKPFEFNRTKEEKLKRKLKKLGLK